MTDHILPHNHGEHLNTELLIDNIAKTEDFQIVADLFKVLGDNSRVRIFWLLCHCEECVINISSMMDKMCIRDSDTQNSSLSFTISAVRCAAPASNTVSSFPT